MEKLARQLTIKFALIQSTFWVSYCAIFNFAAVFLQSKGFDNIQIGIVLSLASILSIILQPMIASYADRTEKLTLRQIILALMIVVLILAIILCIKPDFFLLISISFIVINAVQLTLTSLFNSLALEYINKGIPINYGLARGMGSVSFAIVSFPLGFLVNRYGSNLLLVIFLVFYCFVMASVYRFKLSTSELTTITNRMDAYQEPTNIYTKTNTNESSNSVPTGIFTFFIKYHKFSFFLVGFIMIFYSHNIINTYLINILENVGGDKSNLGISLSISAAVEVPTMVSFIYIIKKLKGNVLIKTSAFFFLLKVFVIWLAPNVFTVYLSQALQMVSFALFTPASVYYVNSIIEAKDRVKGQAMLAVAIMGISGTMANVTGGNILDSSGVSNMLLLGTIISAIGFVIVCMTTQTTE